MSMVLWMLSGPRQGSFVPFTDEEEARALIESGEAQDARKTSAISARKPGYSVREMRPTESVVVAEVETTAPQPQHTPSKKRKKKRK